MSAFDQAFAVVVGHKGGFDDTHADPGNWTGGAVGVGALHGTKFGISAAAYPTVDIANLTLDDAEAIYRRDYWLTVQGDELPAPLALLVFDAAVNNGVKRASEWLQEAVGAATDGRVGPLTIAAVARAVAAEGLFPICAEFQAQRLDFMAGLSTWRSFGLGWARRLCSLPYQAVQMQGSPRDPRSAQSLRCRAGGVRGRGHRDRHYAEADRLRAQGAQRSGCLGGAERGRGACQGRGPVGRNHRRHRRGNSCRVGESLGGGCRDADGGAMMDAIRTALTGPDNATYDPARIWSSGGLAVYLGMMAWSVTVHHAPFDPVQHAAGIGALLASSAAAVRIKHATEPLP